MAESQEDDKEQSMKAWFVATIMTTIFRAHSPVSSTIQRVLYHTSHPTPSALCIDWYVHAEKYTFQLSSLRCTQWKGEPCNQWVHKTWWHTSKEVCT